MPINPENQEEQPVVCRWKDPVGHSKKWRVFLFVRQHWMELFLVLGVILLIDTLASGIRIDDCFGFEEFGCRKGEISGYYAHRNTARVAIGMIVIGILALFQRRRS